MAQKSSIEWTDGTWPIVQGCDYESPGCSHCYAVPLLWRLSHNPNQTISGPLQGVVTKNVAGKLHFTGKVALREDRLDWPLKWRKPMKIFVPSHGDLFHPAVPDEFIDKVFAVMAMAPHHTYQVLTKRTDRMRAYFESRRHGDPWAEAADAVADLAGIEDHPVVLEPRHIPLPNVWLGCSVEDQPRADERIPDLLATPAKVRFLSCEPLLTQVSIMEYLYRDLDVTGRFRTHHGKRQMEFKHKGPLDDLHWVIAGGESGPRARPSHPDWFRSLRDQCGAAGVPFFFKQHGEWLSTRDDDGQISYGKHERHGWSVDTTQEAFAYRVGKKAAGATLDGREWREFPR